MIIYWNDDIIQMLTYMNFNTVSGTECHIYQNKTVYRNDDIISDGQ